MYGSLGFCYEISALRVELRLLCAEVVVYRRALEYTLLYAAALAELVVVHLQNHAEALYEEYAAEYGSISSLCMMIAVTAMIPPIVSDPVSPMNTCAG